MFKSNLLNSNIISVISKMGHYNTICIADAGLPIPKGVERIDLAIYKGMPPFKDVLKIIFENMKIQKIYLASEIKERNLKVYSDILEIVNETNIEYIKHEEFKERTKLCIAIIRTGECTPFSNIILESGVNF